MKKSLILIVLLLIVNSIAFCQDTTINAKTYQHILVALDNCDSEVTFLKNQLQQCNLSDSLKSVVHKKYMTKCEKELAEKDKQIKKAKRKSSFKGFTIGIGTGVVLISLIKLLII